MAQKLTELKEELNSIKNSPADKIEQNFYAFMLKAKDTLGEASYLMAQFYFEYGHFILQQQEANLDLFNDTPLAGKQQEDQAEQQQNIPEGQQQDHTQEDNPPEHIPKLQLQEQQEGDKQTQVKQAQNQPEQPAVAESQKQEKQAEADQQQNSQIYDDKDICVMNLELAVNLFEEQRLKIKNNDSNTNIEEVLNGLRRARTRLGDLYLNDENFTKCVECYEKVIQTQSEREGFDCNRLISELYYLIGNAYLYDNQQNCEVKAISEYIKAIKILLNHLKITLSYDISAFEVPNQQKTKVDRTHFMAAPADSDSVIQIKNVISCLLDKIEDANNQISMRESYESDKQKSKKESYSSQFEFKKQPEIINLGKFGNRIRKRMPQMEGQNELPFKENGIISNLDIFQKKQEEKRPQE